MQFGSGLVGKLLVLALLVGVGVGVSSPVEAGSLLDWWLGLIGKNPVSVPEPATLALFATGVAAVGLMRRRRLKQS